MEHMTVLFYLCLSGTAFMSLVTIGAYIMALWLNDWNIKKAHTMLGGARRG